MKNTSKRNCFILFVILSINYSIDVSAETYPVVFDHIVYNFGDIYTSEGPKKCTFTLTNNGNIPISIVSIKTSCGCTGASCKKYNLAPGEHTSIDVIYKNEDGPYPFDKTICVYTTVRDSPYILHVRGNVLEVPLSPRKMYPFRWKDVGFINQNIDLGKIKQGDTLKDSIRVYNFSNKETTLYVKSSLFQFENVQNKIPPKDYIYIPFYASISKSLLGNSTSSITIFNDEYEASHVTLYTRFQVFPDIPDRQKESRIEINNKYINLGKIVNNKDRMFSFDIINKGEYPIQIYKVDTPSEILNLNSGTSISLETGSKLTVKLLVTDKNHTKKSKVGIIALYSNSYETTEYIYVSYYIPNKIGLFRERLKTFLKSGTF